MKSGGIIAVIAALAVGLFLFVRGRQAEDVEVAARGTAGVPLGAERGGLERGGAAGSGLRDKRRREVQGVTTRSGASGSAAGAGAPDPFRAGTTAGGVGGPAAAGAPGAARGDVDAIGSVRVPDLTHREAPKAGSTGPVVDYDAEGNQVVEEPIPEVAFESPEDHIFPTDSQEEVQDAGPIGGGSGTVSFWIKPEWGAGSEEDATFVQLGDSGLEITKNVNYLRFQYHDSAGNENGLGSNLAGWVPNEWRMVTATWAGSQLTLYVDGVMVSQNRYANPPEFQSETKVYVGSSFPSGAPAAPASLGTLRVLNRDSSPAEIVDRYRAGPPKVR